MIYDLAEWVLMGLNMNVPGMCRFGSVFVHGNDTNDVSPRERGLRAPRGKLLKWAGSAGQRKKTRGSRWTDPRDLPHYFSLESTSMKVSMEVKFSSTESFLL